MTTNVIPVTGLEYTLVPDGTPLGSDLGTDGYPYPGSQTPYSFSGVTISYDSSPALNDYRIQTKFRVVSYVPAVPSSPGSGTQGQPGYVPPTAAADAYYTYVYPEWNIVSQTLTCTSHATATPGNPFEQNVGDELFGASAGTYLLTPAEAGITNGKKYDYFKVFDQTQIDYIPRLSNYNAGIVENEKVPTTPYNPSANPPEYPTDTVTAFVPDERESVTVSYSLTTVYSYLDTQFTDTITFTQTVNQNVGDWKTVIKQLIERSNYKHNITPSMPDTRGAEYSTPGINQDGTPDYSEAT